MKKVTSHYLIYTVAMKQTIDTHEELLPVLSVKQFCIDIQCDKRGQSAIDRSESSPTSQSLLPGGILECRSQ